VAFGSGADVPFIFNIGVKEVTLTRHGIILAKSGSPYGRAFDDPTISAHYFFCISEHEGKTGACFHLTRDTTQRQPKPSNSPARDVDLHRVPVVKTTLVFD